MERLNKGLLHFSANMGATCILLSSFPNLTLARERFPLNCQNILFLFNLFMLFSSYMYECAVPHLFNTWTDLQKSGSAVSGESTFCKCSAKFWSMNVKFKITRKLYSAYFINDVNHVNRRKKESIWVKFVIYAFLSQFLLLLL